MYIERLIYPVLVLGYGKRIGIWLQGCKHKCKGCINPELWDIKESSNMSVEKTSLCVREICEKNQVDGITITGGDPMNQSEEVHELLCNIADLKKEILLYTGYTREKLFEIPKGKEIVDIVDVLIDGKYIEELNDNAIPLRGSTNQNIYYKNKSVENKYIDYLKKGRQLQNFYCQDYMLSLGIHNRGETNGDYAKMAKRNGDF